jgi:adenylate kinase
LTILGPPGAGKGTQSIIIAKHFNIAHISTGDIFRFHIKNDTELGKNIKYNMNNGILIDDEIVLDIIRDRLKALDCKKGFILDGFPRNIIQANGFEPSFDAAILLNLNDDEVLDRLRGRMICSNCGCMYHLVVSPPKSLFYCDLCKARLVQREDDNLYIIKDRLRIYYNLIKPVISYYQDKDILFELESGMDRGKTSKILIDYLESVGSGV